MRNLAFFAAFSAISATETAHQVAAQFPACPQWFYSAGDRWLARYPEIPGIQIFASSERCAIQCKASFRSDAANYTSEPPLLSDSPYRIASSTKPFTAVAVLKLFEEGVLDLHAPVQKYLPDWAQETLRHQQGAKNASQVTPWLLLHHTSGLADHGSDRRYMELFMKDPFQRLEPQDTLEWAAAHMTPLSPPGAEFHYSDTGYIYLGLVVSSLTGLTLATAVREFVQLGKLGMSSTYWEIFEDPPSGVLPRAGQYLGDVDVTNFDASFDLYGGGGLVSNAEDLSFFARAVHQGKLLNQQTMELLRTTVPAPLYNSSYGCGWFHATIAGEEAWHHSGFWGTWMYYLPRLDLTLSGTVNQNSRAKITPKIVEEMVRKFLETSTCAKYSDMDEL